MEVQEVKPVGRRLINYVEICNTLNVYLHCENPLQVEQYWIDDYSLQEGDFDITDVDKSLAEIIPVPTQIGKVYSKLIVNTMDSKENYVDGIMRVYNNEICDVIDNYNCSAFYEPSYVIARAYQAGGF